MPTYRYKGRNQRGEAIDGSIEATTADAVATQLFNSGVTPIDILETKAGTDVLGSLRLRLGEGRVRLDELALFCRQMYTLLKAGVPIMQALRGLRESTANPALARTIGQLNEGLDAGQDLGTALKRHPKIFSSLFVSLVQVGETTGSLEGAFLRLAQHLEFEKQTRERIKSALRYPAFVMLAIIAAIVVINIWVIPAFAKLYSGFNVELPWATRLLIATSDFTVNYWPAMLFVVVTGFLLATNYVRTESGRYRWHKLKLGIPIVGGIIFRATMGRFARALAITARTGVPLVQGLTVVSRAVDNEYIGARIAQMRDGIERGETIARTAAATGMFPPLVIQMISVGEDTGAIDDLMEEVGSYYEREVDYQVKNLSASLEPILTGAVGVLVFILALGIFLPMWDLAQVARRTP